MGEMAEEAVDQAMNDWFENYDDYHGEQDEDYWGIEIPAFIGFRPAR